jgi:hypothetical protein
MTNIKTLEVFDPCMEWWYWKYLIVGDIDMTFLSRPLRFMSCNILCFCMNSLKSIGMLMGECIKLSS